MLSTSTQPTNQIDPELLVEFEDNLISSARNDPARLATYLFKTDTGDPMIPRRFHREWLKSFVENDSTLLIAARGHGKSEYVSAVFPAWWLGHHPNALVLHVTETDDLAARFSRRLQALVVSEEYRKVFPDFPGPGRKWTENEWTLNIPGQRDPTWRCCGRGGSITGGRATLCILDDIATYENCRTIGERRRTMEWYHTTLVPMLIPGAKKLIAGSRYHENDFYSFLIGAGMNTLLYPAEDSVGNILWPQRFDRAHLNEQKIPPDGSAMSYASQWMCTPLVADGEVFKAEMFTVVREPAPIKSLWWVWDTATTAATHADFTAGVLGGMASDGDCYILDARRGQWEPSMAKREIIRAYRESQARHPGQIAGALAEDTAAGKTLQQWLKEGAPDIPMVLVSHEGKEKYARAAPILPYVEAGRVKLVQGIWNDDWIAELVSFTSDDRHSHDDWTDASVYLWRRVFVPKRRMMACPSGA